MKNIKRKTEKEIMQQKAGDYASQSDECFNQMENAFVAGWKACKNYNKKKSK